MPVYLRNFYTQRLIEVKKEENAATDKANKKITSSNNPNMKLR